MGLLPQEMDILPPTDDRIFKAILTSPEAKPFLMKLISGIIGRTVVDATIHSNEIPISDTLEKSERFDVNCKIDDGSQVNIEIQASRMEEGKGGEHKNLKGRIVYYLCDLHSSQPAKGQLRYDRLARTYQVTFCSYTVFPQRKAYLNSFSIRHDMDNELMHDAVQAVVIELSKLDDVVIKPPKTMTDLEKFSVFFEYAANPAYRDTVNKVIESEEVLTVASNVLMSISQDEGERAIFRSRKKFQMDMASNFATAIDNAKDEGKKDAELKIAQNAKAMGMDSETIIKLTGLTSEEIESLPTMNAQVK